MARFYRHVLSAETGIAPRAENGPLALAAIAARIGGTARRGELVACFAPAPATRHLLVYAARVARVISAPGYAAQYGFAGRCMHRTRRVAEDEAFAPVVIFDAAQTWYFGAHPMPVPEHLCTGRGPGALPADPRALLAWLRSDFAPAQQGGTIAC